MMKPLTILLGYLCVSVITLAAPAQIQVTKCTVTAGKSRGLDSISFSGILNAAETDLRTAMADGNDIIVSIDANDMPYPLDFAFPLNDVSLKKSKYVNASQVFKLNTKNGNMMFSAKNVDLTGLAAPLTVKIVIGDYLAEYKIDKTIINGGKPCPAVLMMWVWNNLDITKFAFKPGKNAGTDTLSAQGTFSVSGSFLLPAEPFVLTLGSQTFTVKGNSSKLVNGVVSYTNARAKEGGFVSARFDTNTGVFSIAVKNASVASYGNTPMDLNLFSITLAGLETVDLGPKMSNSMWELTHYDNSGFYWNYTLNTGSGELNRDVYNSYSNSYTVTDDQTEALTEFSFYTGTDGAYLRGFVFDSDFVGEIHLDSFDILYWPAELRRGQSYNSPSSSLSGYFKVGRTSINIEGTIVSQITAAPNLSPVVYKGQTYQAIQFTEVLDIQLDIINPADSSSILGTIGIKLTTKNYATASLGILKFNRSAKVSVNISGTFSASQTVNENAVLADTNASE